MRIDDYAAALAMTRHILSRGHRRVGFILGHPNQSASAQRYAGYRTALKEAGLVLDRTLIRAGLFTYRSGLKAADALLSLPKPPTAIFASNDDMAAAAITVAHRRRLDVPADLTVCGFDDTDFARSIWPELTTIRQPIMAMARAAVATVVNCVNSRRAGSAEDCRQILVDFALIRRESDAPPRT